MNASHTQGTHYDLIIVGGGMVGTALACALADVSLKIALVEGREPAMDWPSEGFDARVSAITDEMLLAAARAIRGTAQAEGVAADRIVPTLLSADLVPNVAVATHAAAREAGVASSSNP